MSTTRIPAYKRSNPEGMLLWFSEMSGKGLLFHPEDEPASIVNVETGDSLFSAEECTEVEGILRSMFEEHGNDVIEACYPVFMRACGQMAALDS